MDLGAGALLFVLCVEDREPLCIRTPPEVDLSELEPRLAKEKEGSPVVDASPPGSPPSCLHCS